MNRLSIGRGGHHLSRLSTLDSRLATLDSRRSPLDTRHHVEISNSFFDGSFGKAACGSVWYQNATELTAAIKRIGDFEVSVGVYPEKHPQSPSLAFDLDVLRQKVDAGATRGISQFFFEPATFLRFRDAVADAGIKIDLTPGIMPVTNFKGLRRMAAACEAAIPDWLGELFEGLDEDADTRKLLASAVAVELCLGLEREGVENFHFYTLNRADLVFAIGRILGLKAVSA